MNYDADDDGRVINVYLDASLNVSEIRHRVRNDSVNLFMIQGRVRVSLGQVAFQAVAKIDDMLLVRLVFYVHMTKPNGFRLRYIEAVVSQWDLP